MFSSYDLMPLDTEVGLPKAVLCFVDVVIFFQTFGSPGNGFREGSGFGEEGRWAGYAGQGGEGERRLVECQLHSVLQPVS